MSERRTDRRVTDADEIREMIATLGAMAHMMRAQPADELRTAAVEAGRDPMLVDHALRIIARVVRSKRYDPIMSHHLHRGPAEIREAVKFLAGLAHLHVVPDGAEAAGAYAEALIAAGRKDRQRTEPWREHYVEGSRVVTVGAGGWKPAP